MTEFIIGIILLSGVGCANIILWIFIGIRNER